MKNKYYKIVIVALGLLVQQVYYASEKNFIKKTQEKLKLSNPNHQYACHTIGLFTSGMFYKEFKKLSVTPLVYGTVAFIGCPTVINSSLFVAKNTKHWILNHTDLEKPRIKEKK